MSASRPFAAVSTVRPAPWSPSDVTSRIERSSSTRSTRSSTASFLHPVARVIRDRDRLDVDLDVRETGRRNTHDRVGRTRPCEVATPKLHDLREVRRRRRSRGATRTGYRSEAGKLGASPRAVVHVHIRILSLSEACKNHKPPREVPWTEPASQIRSKDGAIAGTFGDARPCPYERASPPRAPKTTAWDDDQAPAARDWRPPRSCIRGRAAVAPPLSPSMRWALATSVRRTDAAMLVSCRR